MSAATPLDERERQWLPIAAKAFGELGYRGATLPAIAERCHADVQELRRLWPNKTALFIAAMELAYEAAERTWTMLLHPEPTFEAAERLLAFASQCGDEFSVSGMLLTGMDEADKPRIRKTLRRLNRRLARFLAREVAEMHIAALQGDPSEVSLRAQAGAVLRHLAHVQQDVDDATHAARDALIADLDQAVAPYRPVGDV